jgi:tetratricopeptide (TPR) repeat protein
MKGDTSCNANVDDDDDDDDDDAVWYQQAVLVSNQSNCYFEMGQYEKSMENAQLCLELLEKMARSSEDKGKLRNKNLLRIARAIIYDGKVTMASNIIDECLTE